MKKIFILFFIFTSKSIFAAPKATYFINCKLWSDFEVILPDKKIYPFDGHEKLVLQECIENNVDTEYMQKKITEAVGAIADTKNAGAVMFYLPGIDEVVLYIDPENDITREVVELLNTEYKLKKN